MENFNASEIYQFAIKIEENGETFYKKMCQKIDDEKVIKLFTQLAADEVSHKITFTNMLSKFESYDPGDSYAEEYFQYLKAYAENLVFSFNNFDAAVEKVNTIEDAFRFAIGKELDTIAYFREMKEIVSDADKDKVEAIIKEEREHVVRLSEAKKEYLK
jgi:rubrerythrin